MGEAVDYSYARPGPRSLVDADYEVVLRYLGHDDRCITRAELRRLHDVGLKVALIGQTTILRPLGRSPAGRFDAEKYNNLAADLDAPDWLPIFYVCDVGTEQGRSFPLPGDYAAITDYASGILATPGRPVGQYGPYPVLEHLRDLVVGGRRIECWWQSAGGSGSGRGTGGSIRNDGDGSIRRLSELACMYQEYGGLRVPLTDHNRILQRPVTWAWHPDGPTPDRIKELAMKRLTGDYPGIVGAEWLLHLDGMGHPVRVGISNQASARVYERAEVTSGSEELTDPDELAWFASLPVGNPFPANLSALQLTAAVIAKVEELRTQLVTELGAMSDPELDEAVLAEKVTAALASALTGTVIPAIAAATVDRLAAELAD